MQLPDLLSREGNVLQSNGPFAIFDDVSFGMPGKAINNEGDFQNNSF
jgi:hypothetical protein